MKWIHHRKRLLLAGAVAAAVGCADGGPPTGVPAPGAPPAATVSASSTTGPISVVDDDGRVYTLYPDAQRIVRSGDGATLHLDASQTMLMYAAYVDILSTDAASAQLDQALAEYTVCVPSPMTECGPAAMSLPSGGTGELIFVRDSTTASSSPAPGSGVRLPRSRSPGSTQGDGVSILSYGDDICSRTVQEIFPKQIEFRGKRKTIIGGIFERAVGKVINGILRLEIPSGSVAGAEMLQALAEGQHAALNVNILTWLWNTHGCNGRSLYGGTIFSNYGPSGTGSGTFGWGASYMLDCKWEVWPFSFDSGRTWHRVNVYVCTYRATE